MSSSTKWPLYALLAWAGSIPFVGVALLALAGVERLPLLGPLDGIVSSYALLIVSFMAGTHWGLAVAHLRERVSRLLIASNAIALAAWIGYLLAPADVSAAVSAGAFAVLLAVDYRLKERRAIDAAYLAVRRNVTLVVIAALVLFVLAG